jgi:catechol 2,3-dioxygenase-like lactoylglutathione lyase family enzyme
VLIRVHSWLEDLRICLSKYLHDEGQIGDWNMTATNLVLPKLQHVTITFPPGEERRLRDFYVHVLGFKEKPVPKVVKPLGWIWFYTGTDGVELHCVPDSGPRLQNPVHHFCIEVEDLDLLRSQLKKAGQEIREARPLPFRPRFFTSDPFRNLIEVVRVEGDYISAGEVAEEEKP